MTLTFRRIGAVHLHLQIAFITGRNEDSRNGTMSNLELAGESWFGAFAVCRVGHGSLVPSHGLRTSSTACIHSTLGSTAHGTR